MPTYVTKIKKQAGCKMIVIPALLARTSMLGVGDTLLLEPRIDGTIIIYPPPLVNEALRVARERSEQQGGSNG